MARLPGWKIVLSLPLLLGVFACSSPVEPRSGITLLVTNRPCQAGQCAAVRVLGFPSNQPLTPGGNWSLDLGLLTGPSACLSIPASGIFRVIGVSSDGTKADTTTYNWTSADRFSLGAQPESASRFTAAPSTGEFVPSGAAGWSVTLPGAGPISSGPACVP